MADYTVDVLVDVDSSQLDAAERKIKDMMGKKIPVELDIDKNALKDKRIKVKADLVTDKDSLKKLRENLKNHKNKRVPVKTKLVLDGDSFNSFDKSLGKRRIPVRARLILDDPDGLDRERVRVRADLDIDRNSLRNQKAYVDVEFDKDGLNRLKNEKITVKADVDVDKDKLSNGLKSSGKDMDTHTSTGTSGKFDPTAASVSSAVAASDSMNRAMGMQPMIIGDVTSANDKMTKSYSRAAAIEDRRRQLLSDMYDYQGKNTKAMRKYGSELRGIEQNIKGATTTFQLDEASDRLDKFKKSADAAGNSGLKFSDEFSRYFSRMAMFGLAFEGIMAGAYAVADMAKNVKEVDTAMTELYRVTDLSSKQYDSLYNGMVNSAENYGSSLSDIVSSTAAWARLGFAPNVSKEMAEVSAMYQHIADLSYEDAVENLVTGYKGFEKELLSEQKFDGNEAAAMEYVADVYNEIGNNFAISSGQVGDSLTRAASALQVGGNTFEESAAMVTAVSEVTQDPEKAGSAMKILSMRLRGMKGELEQVEAGAGEGVESISKMQTQVLNMTGGKVNIFDENGDFKSTYDIMQGISEVWDDLSSVDQATLLETIAGKNRANDVAALIDNWDTAEAVVEQTGEAMGSAEREHAKYLDSIEGRVADLSSSWQVFSNTAMSEDFAKNMVSGVDTMLESLTPLVETFGSLPLLVGTAGVALSAFANKGLVKTRLDSKTGKTQAYSHKGQFLFGTAEQKLMQKTGMNIPQALSAFGGPLFDGVVKSNYDKSNFKRDLEHLDKDTSRLAGAFDKYKKTGVFDLDSLTDPKDTGAKDVRKWLKDNKEGFREASWGGESGKQAFIEKYKKDAFAADRLAKLADPTAHNRVANRLELFNEINSAVDSADGKSKAYGLTLGEIADRVSATDAEMGNYIRDLDEHNKSADEARKKQEAMGKEYNKNSDLYRKRHAAQFGADGLTKFKMGKTVASLGTKALAGIASGGTALLGALAFDAALTGIMKLITYEKDLAREVDEATSVYKKNRSELTKNSVAYEEAAERYMKLKDGVTSANHNRSLTPEEYQEYLDLSNQIAEQTPYLIRGFDAQGNAILKATDSIEDYNDAYNKEIIKENDKIINGDGEDFKGFKEIVKDYKNATADLTRETSEMGLLEDIMGSGTLDSDSVYDLIKNKSNVGVALATSLKKAMDEAGEEASVDFNSWFPGGSEKIADYISAVCSEHPEIASSIIDNYNQTFAKEAEGIKSVMQAYLENGILEGDYSGIDEEMQGIASQLVSGLDEQFLSNLSNTKGEEGLKEYVDNLLKSLDDLSALETEQFKEGFDLASQFQEGELTYGEYINKLNEFENLLGDIGLNDEIKSQIRTAFGIEDVFNEYNALTNRLVQEFDNQALGREIAVKMVEGLSSAEVTAMNKLIDEGRIDFSEIKGYFDDIEEVGITDNIESLGNINLNDRRTLPWNEKNFNKYKDALASWGHEIGEFSEVQTNWPSRTLAASKFFNIDGEQVPIAFTPMLQTPRGGEPELLDNKTLTGYVNSLIEKATSEGSVNGTAWNAAEILALDAEGLEYEGKKISRVLGQVGGDAEQAVRKINYLADAGFINWEAEDILNQVKSQADYMTAMEYQVDLEGNLANIESLTAALKEARSGVGMSMESLNAIKSIYSDIEGYDAATLFEETANGINLNNEALNNLETKRLKSASEDIKEQINTLEEYRKGLRDSVKTAEGDRKAEITDEIEAINKQISSLAQQGAILDGMNSAYAKWLRTEDTENGPGSDRDMYTTTQGALAGIKKELDNGWADAGTRDFFDYLFGEKNWNNAGKFVDDYRAKWNTLDDTIAGTSYSINDFFKVDDEGNVTSEGIANFFRAAEELEDDLGKDIVKTDENGNFRGFNFNLLEEWKDGELVRTGDQVLADKMGIGIEFLQSMLRASRDMGFVIDIDGNWTHLADIENEAIAAQEALNGLFQKDDPLSRKYEFDFNTDDLTELTKNLDYLKSDERFWETDENGKITDFKEDVEGAQDALKMATALQTKINIADDIYTGLSVDDKVFEEPLEKLQEAEDKVNAINLMELDPITNAKDIETYKKDLGEIADYFNEIYHTNEDLSEDLALDKIDTDKNGDISTEEFQAGLDSGAFNMPTSFEVEMSMDESLNNMENTLMMMYAQAIGDEELLLECQIKAGLEVDKSGLENLPEAAQNAADAMFEGSDASIEEQQEVIDYVANLDTSELTDIGEQELEVVMKLLNDGELTEDEKAALEEYGLDPGEIQEWTKDQVDALKYYLDALGLLDTDKANNTNKENKPNEPQGGVKTNENAVSEGKKSYETYASNLDKSEISKASKEEQGVVVKYLNGEEITEGEQEILAKLKLDTSEIDEYGQEGKTHLGKLLAGSGYLKDYELDSEGNIIPVKSEGNFGKDGFSKNISNNAVKQAMAAHDNMPAAELREVENFIADSAINTMEGFQASHLDALVRGLRGSELKGNDADLWNKYGMDAASDLSHGQKDFLADYYTNLAEAYNKYYEDNGSKIAEEAGKQTESKPTVSDGGSLFGKLWDKIFGVETAHAAEPEDVPEFEDAGRTERVIDYTANVDTSALEDVAPEDIEVMVKYANEGAEALTENEMEIVAKYIPDTAEVDGWSVEEKQAFVRFLVESGLVDGYTVDPKTGDVIYEGDYSDTGEAPDKNGKVVYEADTSGISTGLAAAAAVIRATAPVVYAPDLGECQGVVGDDGSGSVIYTPNVTGCPPSVPDATGRVNYVIGTVQKLAGDFGGGADVDGTAHVDGTAFADGTSKKNKNSAKDIEIANKKSRRKTKEKNEKKKKEVKKNNEEIRKRNKQNSSDVINKGGKAFSHGNWGTKSSGTALVGELGEELLVRNGRWYTIGSDSAEFVNYKKDDIIFNAEQTKQIFEKGKITHGNGRGKALASGTAFSDGLGGLPSYYPSSNSGNSTTSSSSSSSNSNSNEEFEEAIDWIEKAIDRLQRAIDELDTKLGSTYRSWSERNKSIAENIGNITDMIDLQKKAYDRYIEEANSVGLSDDYAEKVRNGTIDIETITDEDLNEKIGEYTEWYEKALDCKDALVELQEAQSELYETSFEHVATEYEGYLAAIEHEKTMLEEYINQSEERGWIVSTEYYDALIKNQKETTKELEKERAALIKKMHESTDSGAIVKGSEAWYEMIQEIDDITASIEEGSTALIEYANNIRDIEWEVFDFLQDQINDITTEAEFLIDLMSNKKLYEDNGQLTDEGMATMGVHGVNYNVHMYQADMYGEEVKNVDKLLEDDPYDQELIERRRELLELQQESIMAAEEEKNAIRDMVEEGINLELESLEELIDKYLEALDAEKDLYDYQRQVKEQAEEIASLEKQVSAFEGDDSEEAKQKIQELKVSLEEAEADLEETEYDKYIDDQERLLDELYTEYEEILNERLDNIDALVADMIEQINANSAQINATIAEQTSNVGYTISTELNKIFNGGKDISGINTLITQYGNDFKNKLSVTNNTLNAMHLNVQKMIGQLNKLAKTNVTAAKTKSQAEAEKKRKAEAEAAAKKEAENKKNKKATDEVMWGIAADIWINGSASGWGNDPYRSGALTSVFGAETAKEIQNRINKHAHNGDLFKWYGNKDLSKYHRKNFASGGKNINKHQLAWTQEEGTEFIIRPSDGAVLTPIAKGDSVLNAAATNNIWDMANDPSGFIKDNMDIAGVSIPSNGSNNNTYIQNLDKVVFSLPNITNYNEFVSELQRDKNFERLVKSMTIDRLAGGSSLAKTKSIR